MANSDIIKIGFDYRASLEQFEKETNGVFDGISDKAGKQKITIQLDAKDDKVIDKIKELQKLKLDKFTFEFGNSGLKEQLQTFDKLENKINEIISLSKGIDLSFNTKNKTEAYNQLKKYADAFKDYYGNEEAMATNAGAKAGYAYYKAYEEALRKGVAQSKLEKVTVDFDVNDSIFSKESIVENRIKEFENFQKYGKADESNLIAEITLLENRLLKFNSAYSQVKANLGDAPITPEITKNIEEYVRLLEVAESRAKDVELFGYSSEDINSDKDLANMYLDFAKEDATAENKKYIESLKEEEIQAVATAEAEQKLAEAQKETVSNTSNSNNSQIEELKSDIQEVKTELGDVKDRISSIESNGFENVREDVEKTKESVKELNSELTEMKSNLSSTSQETNISSEIKDAFPKTSENLEQVAQSEQKVQQEAVATDKALDNISFTPNAEGFDDIIAKFGILREQAEQITKIIKTTKQTADGTPDISYKATLKNGSSYYLGENSTPQVLNASETVYDAKADNTKKLEREKQIWNELTTSLERYATIQKRIASNNALSTDNEEATKLLEHIHELQRNDILPTEKLTASNEKLQQINQTVTDLKAKLKESTLDSLQGSIDKYQKIYNQRSTYSSDFTPSEQYTKNLTELNTAIKNLVKYKDELKNVGEVTVEQEAHLKGLVAACKKASDSFKSLSASEKGASQIAVDKLVQRINKDLDECTNYSKEAKLGLRALRDELESANPRNLKEITSEIINIENAEIRAGRAGRSFFDTLKNSGFHQIAAQMAGMVGVYDVINGLKQVASTVIDLNTQITDLAKVSEATSSQIYDDFSSYADIAKDIGGTISDTISATADWSRNGYNLPDSKELARVALLYKNVGDGIDIDTANESLISTLRGFKMEADEAEKIIDIFNNVSNNEPIDSGGIGEALQRSAASFNAANTSLQESVALISTTNSVIQNPEKVGNMWKVVSMRIRSATSELEQAGEDTDGLVTSTADLQKMIKAMTGYDILESDGKTFKSIYDIVLNISKVWNNLSDLDQSSLLQALAGKQQSNALAAALSNPELLEKSYQEAMDSAGSAAEEEKKYQQSVQYSIDQTKAKLEELSADLLSSDFLKGAIDAGGKLIDVLDGIVKSGNAIPAVATAIAAALSFKNVG